MHRCVQNFKSLTLWAFHPGMRSMQRLAVMECPKENSYYVEKFFTLFNQALSEYLGEEGYKWDPAALMMDEAGCNFDAVGKVVMIFVSIRHLRVNSISNNALKKNPNDERG